MGNGDNLIERRKEQVPFPGPEKRKCPYSGCTKPDEAAHKAVKQVFGIMGINVDEPREIERFREGLRFGESLHKMANKSVMTAVVMITSALVIATFIGLAVKLEFFMSGGGQ